VTMSGSGVHSMLTTYATLNEQAGQAFDNVTTYKPQLTLEDATMLRRIPEFDDNIITSIISIFPSMLMLSGGNFMCYRNLRPKSVNEFEMVWTYVGYADDSADMSDLRLRQMNLFGPGGYVSIEDAEALEIVQRAIEGEHREDYSGVVALGGRDVRDQPHLVTEVAIRAFWHGYRDLMGLKLAS
jgi:anthranilate 1,2-dioxygenase large subunit